MSQHQKRDDLIRILAALGAGSPDEACDKIETLEKDNAVLREKNAELAGFVEKFCEVCEAHAGTSGESVSELLDAALELEMWPQ